MKIKTVIFELALVYVLLMSSVLYAAQEKREETILFPKGSTSAIVQGTITGSQYVTYKIRAGTGQHMIVTLKTNHNGNYFNIYKPGSGPGSEAMYAATMNGLRYEGILPVDGEYILSVFLMRYAARRDEKATYSLEVTIDGERNTGEWQITHKNRLIIGGLAPVKKNST
jgi:hypothetical protein